MSFRDYGDDVTFPCCSEKEYEKNLKESLDWIKKKYGKKVANEFRTLENKKRKWHLEKLVETEDTRQNFWSILHYNIFKDSVIHRGALYTMNKEK